MRLILFKGPAPLVKTVLSHIEGALIGPSPGWHKRALAGGNPGRVYFHIGFCAGLLSSVFRRGLGPGSPGVEDGPLGHGQERAARQSGCQHALDVYGPGDIFLKPLLLRIFIRILSIAKNKITLNSGVLGVDFDLR